MTAAPAFGEEVTGVDAGLAHASSATASVGTKRFMKPSLLSVTDSLQALQITQAVRLASDVPTVLRSRGFRVVIYLPPAEHGPAHVHVRNPDGNAKIELSPIRVVKVWRRMTDADVRAAVRVVEENIELLLSGGGKFMADKFMVTDAQIAQARARAERDRAIGLAATAVRYDQPSRRLILELSNGNLFGIPVRALPHIAGASDDVLATVELLGEELIHIDALDADYSVAGLIQRAFEQSLAARTLGAAGGQARSHAKSSAARLNGAKGGRPRTSARVAETAPQGSTAYASTGKGRKSAKAGRTREKAGAKRNPKRK
jgi:hypothetical protein